MAWVQCRLKALRYKAWVIRTDNPKRLLCRTDVFSRTKSKRRHYNGEQISQLTIEAVVSNYAFLLKLERNGRTLEKKLVMISTQKSTRAQLSSCH